MHFLKLNHYRTTHNISFNIKYYNILFYYCQLLINFYEEGFGNLSREFWLSLSKVHCLIPNGANTLQVHLGDFKNNTDYAQYSTFNIGDSITE